MCWNIDVTLNRWELDGVDDYSFGCSGSRSAEETENDTYLRAWDLIPPNEPWTYLYPFLARIARHVSIDRCRRQASLKRSAYVVEGSRPSIATV